MKPTLFVSDLHLSAERPKRIADFLYFLKHIASNAQALYLLGDVFDYWLGDDALDPVYQPVIDAFSNLVASGVTAYWMEGNRDFLVGAQFFRETGLTPLADPTLHTIYGKSVLLSHGDTLCTDDVDYQAFRRIVRHPAYQAAFLAESIATRRTQVMNLQIQSKQEKSQKSMLIMDVNVAAVAALFSEYPTAEILIHGHTHRPARHTVTLGDTQRMRWVLGDWYSEGSYLRMDAQGLELLRLQITTL